MSDPNNGVHRPSSLRRCPVGKIPGTHLINYKCSASLPPRTSLEVGGVGLSSYDPCTLPGYPGLILRCGALRQARRTRKSVRKQKRVVYLPTRSSRSTRPPSVTAKWAFRMSVVNTTFQIPLRQPIRWSAVAGARWAVNTGCSDITTTKIFIVRHPYSRSKPL